MTTCPCGHGEHQHDREAVPELCMICGDSSRCGGRMGWWVLSGDTVLAALRRAHDGENPDLIYAELYANSREDADA